MNFGYCLACINRTGSRRFRPLADGVSCGDCIASGYAIALIVTDVPVPVKQQGKVCKVKEPKPPKQPRQPKVKLKSPQQLDRLADESLLAQIYQDGIGDNWIGEAQEALGWDKKRIMFCGRRLRRKGTIRLTVEQRVLAELSHNVMKDTHNISERLSMCYDYCFQVLEKLVKQGKAERHAGAKGRIFFTLLGDGGDR